MAVAAFFVVAALLVVADRLDVDCLVATPDLFVLEVEGLELLELADLDLAVRLELAVEALREEVRRDAFVDLLDFDEADFEAAALLNRAFLCWAWAGVANRSNVPKRIMRYLRIF